VQRLNLRQIKDDQQVLIGQRVKDQVAKVEFTKDRIVSDLDATDSIFPFDVHFGAPSLTGS
jgi:hypothetical protein